MNIHSLWFIIKAIWPFLVEIAYGKKQELEVSYKTDKRKTRFMLYVIIVTMLAAFASWKSIQFGLNIVELERRLVEHTKPQASVVQSNKPTPLPLPTPTPAPTLVPHATPYNPYDDAEMRRRLRELDKIR